MDENLTLSTSLKLQQRLSPLQVQYVHMLEMNRVEIEDEVRKEIDDNPALGEAEGSVMENSINTDEDGNEYRESSEEMQRADYGDDDEVPSYRTSINNYSPDDEMPEAVVVAEGSLIDYLEEQLSERDLTEKQQNIAKYIIGNIEDNGYLQRSIQAISDDLVFQTGIDVSNEEVDEVLQIVRDLEPAGVCAEDLRDCLLLQLERKKGSKVNLLAYEVVDKYFDEFSKKHYDKIGAAMNLTTDETREVISEIVSLNPKPANNITGNSTDSHSQQVMPDFSVEVDDDDEITLTLLNKLPDLQIEESFATQYDLIMKSAKKKKAEDSESAFIKQKYESASGFIKILRQRQETLFNTMRAILRHQREFFLTGDEAELKPMVLKDIAQVTGNDVSVISRATSNKFVETQWGIFPLKYFFNEGLQHESGEEVSSREIQSILKTVIEEENKRKPYSDEMLCRILQKKGYEIARRTVGKYREKLGIPVARLRKSIL